MSDETANVYDCKNPMDKCPDCSVSIGEYHAASCDIEQCPRCGHQFLYCACDGDIITDGDSHTFDGLPRIPWTGYVPGTAECHEYNLWSKAIVSRTPSDEFEKLTWVKCDKEDPDARPDYNAIKSQYVWNVELQKFVIPGETK